MRRLSCLIALLACLVLALPAFAAPQKADAISGISSEKVLDIVKANKGKLVFINFFATDFYFVIFIFWLGLNFY